VAGRKVVLEGLAQSGVVQNKCRFFGVVEGDGYLREGESLRIGFA